MKEKEEKKWEGKTGGGQFGQQFLLRFLKRVDVCYLYPILYLVIPFYLIFAAKGRNAIYRYFRDQHQYSRWKSTWCTYKNHIIFGKIVLDKFALMAGNKDQFKLHFTSNCIREMLAKDAGFIIASAHMGNLELSGLSIPHGRKRLNTIIFGGERAEFQKKRNDAFGEMDINLIPVREDMSHLFAIKEAIDNNEVVVIPCDRIYGSPKSVTCQLLNGTAQLPLGAFRLSAQLGVPVFTLFIMKEKDNSYTVYEGAIDSHDELPNSVQRAEAMAKEFAKKMEEKMIEYPTQWFNFFPYWNDNNNIKKQ
ncbi:MAG: lipid A biosynthesis (KDO)2-(lauroyl)-lipid IVA acyltransferase [Paludibacteraceae bacterium]|nr:lipid A biosynthesis (KDO)2-(lauroyl)-lipid IVA acyltransferase [Paludibacteraceae bacterium]MBR5971625.1 lipid A biosynthesis (KDO)2-(lauroyl)-lipid IVA acyltransferase [Paludibacteraceae bacterium]